MAETQNKVKIEVIAGTCPISQYLSVDVPCEVGGPLRDWTKQTPITKIHSTETKVHVIQKDNKPFLIFTITIVYESDES